MWGQRAKHNGDPGHIDDKANKNAECNRDRRGFHIIFDESFDRWNNVMKMECRNGNGQPDR